MKKLIDISGPNANTKVVLLIPEVLHTEEIHQMEHQIESNTRFFSAGRHAPFFSNFALPHPLRGVHSLGLFA